MAEAGAPRVVIVGAGIGGLTLGIALRARGIDVEIVERAAELREVGAAVALSANGSRVMQALGLGERLAAVSTQPTALICRDGRTGEVIASHPGGEAYRRRFGAPFLGIHRVELQRALAAAFGERGLRLGHAATGVSTDGGSASVTLDDGRVLTGDIVVGADGVHSTVRTHVAGDGTEPRYSGTSGFRGLVPRDALPSLPEPRAIQVWMGPGAHLVHYALGRDDDTVNFLAVLDGPHPWPGDAVNVDAEPGELLAAFDGWHPAVREMLGAVEQSPRWALLHQQPLNRWTRGRVALIGDAAHAMLPHHGQGANQSIEDSTCLAGLLASRGVDEALAAYPALRRARTRAVQRSSWEFGTALHLADGDAAAARREAALARYLDRYSWVHAHGAAAVQ